MEKMLDYLKRYWNSNAFRPLQQEVIEHYLKGEDTLVLMPTGGGKSVCFQLPALLEEGQILVISPLISLMQDHSTNGELNQCFSKVITVKTISTANWKTPEMVDLI